MGGHGLGMESWAEKYRGCALVTNVFCHRKNRQANKYKHWHCTGAAVLCPRWKNKPSPTPASDVTHPLKAHIQYKYYSMCTRSERFWKIIKLQFFFSPQEALHEFHPQFQAVNQSVLKKKKFIRQFNYLRRRVLLTDFIEHFDSQFFKLSKFDQISVASS